ncbi:MAG TPA: ferritin-like domain-containing protein [Solirubrobacteraceae bacterium]|nr:ferritin-like domain-containing protein [Solirubrobacteraceae bacterium]
MTKLDLTQIDVDGALQETAAAVADGHTRAGFLRKAGMAGGALAGAGAVLGALAPGASADGWSGQNGRPPAAYGPGDIGILNFALALEYLEAAFYNRATTHMQITDPATKAFLQTTTRDENAHVAALQQALGSNAIAQPQFRFDHIPANQSAFQQTAYVLENTGVHAYLGQLTNICSSAYLAAAGSIALVEGRHAAVIGSIINDSPSGIAPNGPFDTPQTAEQVIGEVNATHFVVGGLPS